MDKELVEQYAQLIGDHAAANFRFLARQYVEFCESPIEEMIALAMPAVFACTQVDFRFWPAPGIAFEEIPAVSNQAVALTFKQVIIGPYRADFVVSFAGPEGSRSLVVVESDGHDFHERTKEQAARDRARDRWMVENKIICLRFTGSEIWRNAFGCVKQIIEVGKRG